MFRKELLFCFALILMGTMDLATTVIGTVYFGAVEINPLFSNLIKANIIVYSVIKLTAVALTGVLFYEAGKIGKTLQSNAHLAKRVLQSGCFTSLMVLTLAVTNNVIAVARVM
jgi:hypothetical protein